ncbi:MAG TPA: hypothetical protein VER04_17245 [Polyangiaceae bacterium]|nr:hypothetical protein [Polyangiaceae bacterium]
MGFADLRAVSLASVNESGRLGLRHTASVELGAASPVKTPDDEESYLDQPIELDPFEDGGNDDQEASDLVVGEEIDVLGESIGDNEPIELDLGSIVGIDERLSEGEDDSDAGFEVDPAVGLTLPDALTPDDGSEGLDDGSITVDESKFPTLEMDDGSEGIAAEREISLGTASDEARVPMAALPWQAHHPLAALEACAALAVSAGAVVAGSSDLLWFQGDATKPLRVAVDGGALSDLVLVGADQDIALASTKSGQLFRRARFASQAEQLTRFREQLRSPHGSRPQLSFGGALGAQRGRVLLWLRDGTLLDVLDAGDRFERLELEGKVLAVARESATVLLGHGRTRTLLTLDRDPAGRVQLSGAALALAHSAAPLLATAKGSLALAEPGRALLVSPDAGQTFRRVAGSASTTAIAGAVLAGRAHFFAAVYRETSDQSDLLLIDPERGEAECIAHLDVGSGHSPADAIERGEWAKVSCLSWHAASGRLWAAGGFGVVSFGPSSG